ncbi:MAG: ABC transporter permease [Candidatus Bathyarchaeia archaeon]
MINETVALTRREVKKWMKNPFLLFMMFVQPVIWLGLFGKALNLTGLISVPPDLLNQLPEQLQGQVDVLLKQMISETFGGTTDYFTYMAAGMLSVIVLFTAMFSGMSVVWDRRFGFLNKLLVAPIPRESIVLAKVSSSVIRSMFQVLLIFGIAFAFGLQVGDAFGILDFFGMFAALFLLSLGLSSMFLAITIRIKSHETVIAVANLLNLPLMFASNALFPIKQMPEWLQTIANFNPISYAGDAVRTFILHSNAGFDAAKVALDFQFLIGFALIFSLAGILIARTGLRKG